MNPSPWITDLQELQSFTTTWITSKNAWTWTKISQAPSLRRCARIRAGLYAARWEAPALAFATPAERSRAHATGMPPRLQDQER
jgi:hypothetical protein